LVKPGDLVNAGQVLGGLPDKALGAVIHAPFNARVTEVTAQHIVLNRL
jgi:Na+-translocating ferredoxin:NAD+ oxidoreductase RnfC subunit